MTRPRQPSGSYGKTQKVKNWKVFSKSEKTILKIESSIQSKRVLSLQSVNPKSLRPLKRLVIRLGCKRWKTPSKTVYAILLNSTSSRSLPNIISCSRAMILHNVRPHNNGSILLAQLGQRLLHRKQRLQPSRARSHSSWSHTQTLRLELLHEQLVLNLMVASSLSVRKTQTAARWWYKEVPVRWKSNNILISSKLRHQYNVKTIVLRHWQSHRCPVRLTS